MTTEQGKAMTAAAMVLDGTHTQAAAARALGISRQAVSQALARIKKKQVKC